MLWMATINPGRTRKRRARKGRPRRRRKLSWWQRMVKKFGGVKAAVRARRKLKRKGKKRKTRRSSRRRGHLRARPRRTSRRHTMARRTRRRRRRLPPRGPGGRFRSRGGRPRRRRRVRSRRRNKLQRFTVWRDRSARSGQFTSRATPRRLKRKRRKSRRRNPVVPVNWNPRRRRRRYRRNSVLPLSWSRNPAGVLGGVLGKAQSFIDISFWTETAIPVAGGFLGTKVVGGMIHGALSKAITLPTGIPGTVIRLATDVLAASGLSYLAGRFLGKKYEENVFLGGVVGIAHSVLKQLIGGTDIGRAIGLDGYGMGLGDDLSEKMKQAVAQRVEAELSGMGAFLTQTALQRQGMAGPVEAGVPAYMGEFITDTDLRAQPNYAASPGGDLRDYDPNNDETAI